MTDDWSAGPPARDVFVAADPDAVAAQVSARFIAELGPLTAAQETVHVSLTGGRVGSAVLRSVAAAPAAATIAWDRVHVWWSDERFVPAADDERNELQARRALLDHVPIPAANIHAMAAAGIGLTLSEGANAYRRTLAEYAAGGPGTDRQPWPRFDLCLLGVGPDAHIASLFPDRAEILVTDVPVVAVTDSPKPPPERISLTLPVINSSERIWLTLTGAEKAAALSLALADANYPSVPAAGAKGRIETLFFVDAAAAAQLPTDLIQPR